MDRKQMCVANLSFKKPSASKSAKSLMRYLTYREGRDEKARQASGKERWTDHGMGGSVVEVMRHCDHLQSDHVLLFSLVINPTPQLMAMVAPEDREQFVRELTENVVDAFFEERGIDTGIEMSFVLHQRLSEDPQNPGLPDPHTHVVLPGTVYDDEFGQRVPLYFSQHKAVNHIEMLHRVTEAQMEQQMERYIGLEWEQRIDQLLAIREQQLQVTQSEPDCMIQDAEGQEWGVWCGVRQETEATSAFGYYREVAAPTEDNADAVRIEFRPLIPHLDHEQAEHHWQWFSQTPEQFQEWVSEQSGMRVSGNERLIEEPRQSMDLDIDF